MSDVIGENYDEQHYFEPIYARYYAAHAGWPRVPTFVSPEYNNASHGHSLIPSLQMNLNRLTCREFVEFVGKNLFSCHGSRTIIFP